MIEGRHLGAGWTSLWGKEVNGGLRAQAWRPLCWTTEICAAALRLPSNTRCQQALLLSFLMGRSAGVMALSISHAWKPSEISGPAILGSGGLFGALGVAECAHHVQTATAVTVRGWPARLAALAALHDRVRRQRQWERRHEAKYLTPTVAVGMAAGLGCCLQPGVRERCAMLCCAVPCSAVLGSIVK